MSLLITLAQIKTVSGNIQYNKEKIIDAIHKAQNEQSQIIVFPELALSGYGANDFLLRQNFIDEINTALTEIAALSHNMIIILGYPEKTKKGLFSSVAIIKSGQILGSHRKMVLPNAELYTENYYLNQGDSPMSITVNGITLGIAISEEIFDPNILPNCDLLLLSSAFNWSHENAMNKELLLRKTAKQQKTPLIFLNAVSGRDNLVFSGNSTIINHNGDVVARLTRFEDDYLTINYNKILTMPALINPPEEGHMVLYKALKFSLQEFINHSDMYETVMVHVSHSLISKLLLVLAVDALGPDRVQAIKFISQHDLPSETQEIIQLCEHLHIALIKKTIDKDIIHTTLEEMAKRANIIPSYEWEENASNRIKNALYLSFAELLKAAPLGAINKTQASLGAIQKEVSAIATYLPFINLYRKDILNLAEYRNTVSHVFDTNSLRKEKERKIKHSMIEAKEVSLEAIDDILYRYLERNETVEYICKQNHDAEFVQSLISIVNQSLSYRHLSALGPKLSAHAFAKGWHNPKAIVLHEEYHL